IPGTSSRKVAFPRDAERYRPRNAIARTFCRIEDSRGIATRYDRTARNFLAAACLAAAITYRARLSPEPKAAAESSPVPR
ncbi:hypothetical protein K1J50_18685, partial [Caldovatus sp. SYSU G05006]|nr:hypothetical protein [Caldovatus aquaticus]